MPIKPWRHALIRSRSVLALLTALAFLGCTPSANDKLQTIKRKKLANNTYLIDNGKRRAIRLHSTDIATEAGQGKIRIDTGGWDTLTTRERLHRFTSCRVYRDKGQTYVDGQKLRDGMIISGTLTL